MHTNTYKRDNVDTEKFHAVPKGIDVLNLGSSHGFCSFYWEDYPKIRSFDFSLPAQYYPMDYAILQQYKSCISRGAVVILPISYFQVTNCYNAELKRLMSFRSYYYKFLHLRYFSDWKLAEAAQYTLPFPKVSCLAMIKGILHDIGEDDIKSVHSTLTTTSPEDRIPFLAKEYFTIWEEDRGSEAEYKKNIQTVQDILDFCYENGFTPVLVSTPIMDALSDMYDKEWPEFLGGGIFSRFTREIIDKNKGLVYLDYSRDKEFAAHSLFLNVDHLNSSGGKLFTSRLLHDLTERGIIIRGYSE